MSRHCIALNTTVSNYYIIRYRDAAMKCLAKQGVLLGKHNVQSLQALIMLVYAMGHSQDPTWVLLGREFPKTLIYNIYDG